MSVFNTSRDTKAKYSLFLGERLALQEYLNPQYPIFYKLYEQMEDAHWRKNEFNMSRDFADMKTLSKGLRHMFNANFQYQIMADSVQGRGPFLLMPFISAPELELAFGSYGRFEQLHSAVYTQILKAVYADPNEILDPLKQLPKEVMYRMQHLIVAYDRFLEKPTKLNLYFLMHAIHILEALQFFNSFTCTFAFNEMQKLEGVGKNLVLISRDENFHTAVAQNVVNTWYNGGDPDPEWQAIAKDPANQSKVFQMWDDAVVAEKKNAVYLFSEGAVLPALTAKGLCDYIEFRANSRMNNIGLPSPYDNHKDNLPWVQRKYLSSKTKQTANQETENDAYRTGTIIKVDPTLARLAMNPKLGG